VIIATAFVAGITLGLIPFALHLRQSIRALDEQNRQLAEIIAEWRDRTGESIPPEIQAILDKYLPGTE
jgi:hypothetical protein